MEYRRLPKGTEQISALGLGMGGIQNSSDDEIISVVDKALSHGINFFDMCAGASNVYAPFGQAIKDRRNELMFQLHFGAVYNDKGDYGWSRKPDEIKHTFEWEMKQLHTDYVDFGFLHCIDEDKDLEDIISNGILNYVPDLKNAGVLHHIGFSSHTPSVAHKVLDLNIADLFMFSINPAYDLEKGDEYGIGTCNERAELLRRCQAIGVGVTVMKPFHGGQLLDEKTSPFGRSLTKYQCLQYALDRPSVLSVLPGVRNPADLDELLGFIDSPPEDNDYTLISEFTPENAVGNCVYCNHCKPCPAGIDVGLVNKYYDLALAGDKMACNHYSKLSVNAGACLKCGHCEARCPFGVKQIQRMTEIEKYFEDNQEEL